MFWCFQFRVQWSSAHKSHTCVFIHITVSESEPQHSLWLWATVNEPQHMVSHCQWAIIIILTQSGKSVSRKSQWVTHNSESVSHNTDSDTVSVPQHRMRHDTVNIIVIILNLCYLIDNDIYLLTTSYQYQLNINNNITLLTTLYFIILLYTHSHTYTYSYTIQNYTYYSWVLWLEATLHYSAVSHSVTLTNIMLELNTYLTWMKLTASFEKLSCWHQLEVNYAWNRLII